MNVRRINPLEHRTIRTGKLISESIWEEGEIHSWEAWKSFGPGEKIAAALINGEFHEISYSYQNVDRALSNKKIKNIKVSFHPNQFKEEVKGGWRVVYKNYLIPIKDIYILKFVDNITGYKFKADTSILDYIQPNTDCDCRAYWSFNPYAVFGTGFNDWCHPSHVKIIKEEVEIEPVSERDWQMNTAVRDIDYNLGNLTRYTKLNFSF